jgi:integrase
VLTSALGPGSDPDRVQPWRPDVTTLVFQRIRRGGVPIVPVPLPAHTQAAWLLGAGMDVDVVVVSERLGHWSPSLTLSVYAPHPGPSARARAGDRHGARVGDTVLT